MFDAHTRRISARKPDRRWIAILAILLVLATLLQGCGAIISRATPRPPSSGGSGQAPAAGQWAGQPAVSFAVSAEGTLLHFKLTAPFGALSQACTIQSEEIKLGSNREFSIGAPEGTPVYVTGRFTGATTASGTYKITACGRGENVTVVMSPEEKEWDATWQGAELVASAPQITATAPSPAGAAAQTTAPAAPSAAPPAAQPSAMPSPTGASPAATQPPTPAVAAEASPAASIRATLVALHEGNGSPLAWAPDGQTLYTGGHALFIHSLASQKEPEEIRAEYAQDLAFSPDGKLLALGGSEAAQLWDVASRGTLGKLEGSGRTEAVAFAPGGATLVTATGGALKVWDVGTGDELRTIPIGDWVGAIAVSPDGHTVAAGDGRGEIQLWDATEGKQLGVLTGHSSRVQSLVFSADGGFLASGSVDQSVRLWDVAARRQARAFMGHTGQVDGVSLSPDGTLLASASWDLTVRLWDTATGAELQRLTGHTSWIHDVAFSPDGTLLASGSPDGLRVWRIEAGAAPQPSAELPGMGPVIAAAAVSESAITLSRVADLQRSEPANVDRAKQVVWSPDGKLLAIGTYHIYILDAETLKHLYTIESVQWTNALAFSPDATLLAAASDEGVTLWDSTGWGEVRTLAGSKNTHSIAFRSDGKILATGTGSTVKLWDVASGEELRTLPGRRNDVQVVAFSPDGKTLASGSGEIVLLDALAGTELLTIESNVVRSLAFSPDGKFLASAATNDPVVRLWDLATGRQVGFFPDHSLQVSSLAFSSDGQILAVGAGLEVKLWDVASGQELRSLGGYSQPVNSIAFSPDGSRLATGGDETAWVWAVQ